MSEKIPKPKDIKFDEIVTEICCHPSKDVVACGEITGEITLHTYSSDSPSRLLLTLPHHKKSCRGLKFSQDGETLYTASKDESVCTVDLNVGAVKHTQNNAHSSAIYAMCLISDFLLATGDDEGNVKVWDTRTHTSVMELKENDDYISDLTTDDEGRMLLATSGDGTLTAFNLRKRRLQMQSETCNAEMLSVAIMKHRTKVVCGTGNKAVNIFSWGEWSDLTDRFPGFKGSVDCMTPITQDILCTGCSDGSVRVVNILPNRFLGIIGKHDGFPVEKLFLTHDKTYITSCSHDQRVKFWDISKVTNENINANEKQNRKVKNRNLNARKEDDFFFDLKNDEEERLNEDKNDDENNHDNDDNDKSDDSDSNSSDSLDDNDDDISDNDNAIADNDDIRDNNDDNNGDDNENESTDNDDISDIDDDNGENLGNET